MKGLYTILMRKFFALYFCIMVFGVSILTLSNLYVLGSRIEELLKYNIGAVLLEGIVGTLFLQGITMAGLKNTRSLLKGLIKSEEHYYKSWNEMVLFPSRIFWGMAGFGVAASAFYHTGEMLYYGDKLSEIFLRLASIVLFEQTLSLILALLFFTGARRLLRPYVLQIPGTLINKFHKSTFYNNLIIIFCCLLIIMIYSILWYTLDRTLKAKPLSINFLAYLSLFDICFGIVIFSFFIREIRDDFSALIEAMTSLLKGSRAQLKAKVPIVSNNEIGNLGLIFNKLQEKVSKEYDEIDAELQLACSIQQGLLPEGERVFGPYAAAGICKPCCDVGGDFFDIIPLDSTKFTVIIGDVVGKGMSAALIMSAVLLLFRNEIRRGGTALEVLDRLNRMVVGLGLKDICLTLGIAVFDMYQKVMQYASAGHVSPYVLKKSGINQLLCSSLPLGINPEEAYDQIEYDVKEDDKFIFYTDGIIDAFDNRHISGFDAFEQILCSTDDTMSAAQQIDFIIGNTECNGKSGHEDDKTLVIVQYNGK